MITLYGSINSSAGRCIWALAESGVPFTLKSVNLRAGEQKQEWFLALNPNGKIPVLVDGDFSLFESYAINWYVAEKYAPQLLGSGVENRARIQQWTHWSGFHVQRHVETVMYAKLFGNSTPEAVEKAKADVIPYLQILDAHLAGKPYMLGETFTLADIHVGSVINLGVSVEMDMAPYAHTSRWLACLKERQAYTEAVHKETTHS
jgi:glutathione S-transferase